MLLKTRQKFASVLQMVELMNKGVRFCYICKYEQVLMKGYHDWSTADILHLNLGQHFKNQ